MGIDALVQEWAAAFNEKDAERLAAAFVDDLRYQDVPLQIVCANKEELKAFVAPWFKAVPDFHVELDEIILQGERAAVQWTWTGTQEGELPPNLPPSGKSFNVRGMSVLEASRDGKLASGIDYWDLLSVLKDLGFA